MENCRVVTLKGNANISNPEYYGFIKVIVDTTGASNNVAINFLNLETGNLMVNVVGCKLLGGKTFVNGKTVIEEGDSMRFAPNDVYNLLVPKYSFPLFGAASGNTGGIAIYNIDDYYGLPETQKQSSGEGGSWITGLSFKASHSNYKCSGNADTILKLANTDVITSLYLNDSNVSLDINSSRLSQFIKLKRFDAGTPTVTGNLRDFITQFMGVDKTTVKARTDTLLFNFFGSSINSVPFRPTTETLQIIINFNGTSSVTIDSRKIDGTVTKSWNYDIDTDTLTEAV